MYNSTLKITDNFPRGLKKFEILCKSNNCWWWIFWKKTHQRIFRVLSDYFIVGEANNGVDAVKNNEFKPDFFFRHSNAGSYWIWSNYLSWRNSTNNFFQQPTTNTL
jgi:hypothetical protein